MGVSTLMRTFTAAALLLVASAAFAANPSSRTGVRMAFDESTGLTVLFGGQTAPDSGTVQSYELDDTWVWTGVRWVQRFPAHKPAGRNSHVLVYDSLRTRMVMFGGRSGLNDLNDTWVYDNNDWTQVLTAGNPSPRLFTGAAYDRDRDRVVLFGGSHSELDSRNAVTVTNYYDTWEFDGSDWTRVATDGPQVVRPLLVYDESRKTMFMVAETDKFEPRMYSYDAATHAWNAVNPATMPPCVNQSAVSYERSTGTLFLDGGVCVTGTLTSSTTEEAWRYDGTNWTKLATKTAVLRTTNSAMTYDAVRNVTLQFGGTIAYGGPYSGTWAFDPSLATDTVQGDWVPFETNAAVPGPRSLAPMEADPVNRVAYLLNGLNDASGYTDFWMYQNGGWSKIVAENTPACGTPFTAFDTDRLKLVATCNDGSTFEWDGTAWKTFADLKTKPTYRQFAAMVYDPSLKKTVLYGGYDTANYIDNTWLWDGTAWTEQKKKAASARALTSMWFDPILKKTVLYGGIGRPRPSDRLQRYNDMWSLDANGWTEIKPAKLPTTRYGAQVAVNPESGRTVLFGGLRLDTDDKGIQKQVYANDTWEWDGSTWTALATNNAPPPRENAAFVYDYSINRFVLYGGYAGYYLSDTWWLQGNTWQVVPEQTKKARAVRR
jgi:hypothetical protein